MPRVEFLLGGFVLVSLDNAPGGEVVKVNLPGSSGTLVGGAGQDGRLAYLAGI